MAVDLNKLVARAKSMLLTPRTEWPVVAAEPATVGGIFSGYVFIMAAIPVVVRLTSSSLLGVSVPFLGSYRIGIGVGVTTAVLTYVLALVGVFVVSLIVEALAPTFGAERNRVQALKTVAYAYTASWVLSIIGIVPGLGLLSAIAGAAYSIYLLNMGLPFTMKCAPDKAVAYTVVTIIVAIIVAFVVNLVAASVVGMGFGINRGLAGLAGGHAGSAAIGNGAVLKDWANKVDTASKQVEAAQKSGDSNAQANAVGQLLGAVAGSGGKVESLAPDRLKPFLPESIGNLKRTQMSVERNAAMGVQISKGTATYSDGAQHTVNLEITDTGSLKGLVGFAAGWAGVEQEKQTDSGYEKTYQNGGQLVHEKWDNGSHYGQYGVVVGSRFSVQAAGNATSINDLKAAIATVDLAGLEALKMDGVQSN